MNCFETVLLVAEIQELKADPKVRNWYSNQLRLMKEKVVATLSFVQQGTLMYKIQLLLVGT